MHGLYAAGDTIKNLSLGLIPQNPQPPTKNPEATALEASLIHGLNGYTSFNERWTPENRKCFKAVRYSGKAE